MSKLLLLTVAVLCVAGTACAGQNSGALAYLSWSPTSQVTDTAAGATNNLYVRFSRDAGLSFKGGEIDVTWDPPSNGAGCFDHLGTNYKTSSGTTCTYLNRGSTVPVVTDDSETHLHVAWANNSTLTGCTSGAAIQIQYETDGCSDPTGCFSLNYASTLDGNNDVDVATIITSVVTVGGGGGHSCLQTPVAPSTWGGIKALYKP